jgi:hypothetical protein
MFLIKFLHKLKMTKLVEGLEIGRNKIEKPFRMIVAGGSGSGKSCFVKKLIETDHFDSTFTEICYIYPDYLDDCPTEFDVDQNVQYVAGLPDKTFFSLLCPNSLIILDDLMIEASKCEDIAKLFTVIARKKNISIILIVQNIYQQGKQFRNIRLNATAIVLFKFYGGYDSNYRLLRDLGMTSLISRKIFDDVYIDRYQYIYIDLHPNRQFVFSSLRTNLFDYYYTIFYKMEYVAIPKSDFLKYFKIIEAKKGKIKAIKNESTLKKLKRRRKSNKKVPEKTSKAEHKSAIENNSSQERSTVSDTSDNSSTTSGTE